MTKPANSTDKPSPSDTPTKRPADNGHKSVVKKSDKQYHADDPHGGDIAKKHEKEEQPVHPGDGRKSWVLSLESLVRTTD